MSDNAKLRTLRAWLVEMNSISVIYAWAQCRMQTIAKIDEMLAEPEPPKTEQCKVHPFAGWWTCSRDTAGCTLAHSYEPLPELVARLHGFVGPDGRGRP